MPHLKKTRYIIFAIGWEKKVQNVFPNGLQKVKSQMMIQRQCQKKKLRTYLQLFENYTKPRLKSLIAVIELKWLFQGSVTLEQFVTKATLLVDEAGYPARHKDRMVCDTLITGISNDIMHGKIIKKGPNITLAQVLEISCLETAIQQSLSQMLHTKPTVNYVKYDKRRKTKGNTNTSSQQQTFGKFHGSGTSPSNSKSDANGKFQSKSRICYRCRKGKHQLDQKCAAIDATCNKCGKKGHYAVICQKGKGLSHSSKSAYIVETMDSVSTEPDYYTECGQPVYVLSCMLQTACTKHQKIPGKS